MKQGELVKYVIIFAPLISSAWVLSYTYTARTMKAERKNVESIEDEALRVDSLRKWDEQYGEDFESAKQSALKLGLDLEGGMYVTLEVNIPKLIEESAQEDAIRDDEIFTEVMAKTREEAETTQEDALDIFIKNFDAIARPAGRNLFDYFELGDLSITEESAVVEKLRENSEDAVAQAREVLGQRINKYKVSEPSITQQGTRRIVLEIPGVTNEDEVRDLIQTTARLEFKLVRNKVDIVQAFKRIDDLLIAERKVREGVIDEVPEATPETTPADTSAALANADTSGVGEIAAGDTTGLARDDTLALAATDTSAADTTVTDTTAADTTSPYAGLDEEEQRKKYEECAPFSSLISAYVINNGQFQPFQLDLVDVAALPDVDYYFQIEAKNLDAYTDIMEREKVQRLIPREFQVLVSANPDLRLKRDQGLEVYEIWGVKSEAELTGDVIVDAGPNFDPTTNQPIVLMSMDSEGSERWARITGANVDKRVAIVLDGRVYSAPVVQSRISGGRSQITGSASIDEARILAIVLKAGALKAPVKIVEERIVGPSLGQDSIDSGVTSSLIAFGLVLLFMLMYYMKGGIVANFAVFINIASTLTLLSAFDGTLTLPGIAGLILTIGMAVDANILIYERIREEIARGRSLRSAVDEGYKKARSAILDSNITTGLTGIILLVFGTGPIQGFAVTLIIGIFMTLFTAIMVSRAVIELFIIRGATSFNFGQPKYIAN